MEPKRTVIRFNYRYRRAYNNSDGAFAVPPTGLLGDQWAVASGDTRHRMRGSVSTQALTNLNAQIMFVAQRDSRGLGIEVRTTCLIRTSFSEAMLTLTAPDMPPLRVPQAGAPGVEMPVRVWESHTTGIDQGQEAEAWATSFLSRERPGRYRLVRMADDQHRGAKLGHAELAYGDAYPFLVLAEESLADLNARMRQPLPMDRFRPNIVIAGGAPYAEDGLDHFRIGGVAFTGMTLCLRCPTTVTDQQTAARGKEPLRTLATYRKQPDGVVFGRNFNHSGTGPIRIGDRVVSRTG